MPNEKREALLKRKRGRSRFAPLVLALALLLIVIAPFAVSSSQVRDGASTIEYGQTPNNGTTASGPEAYPDESQQEQIDQSTLGKPSSFDDYVKFDNSDHSSSATEECDAGECLSRSVLAKLASGATVEGAVADLNRIVALQGIEAVKQTEAYVEFKLPEGLAVQDGIELMRGSSSVVGPQANLVYKKYDETESAQASEAPVSGLTESAETQRSEFTAGSASGLGGGGSTSTPNGSQVQPQAVTLDYPPNDKLWSDQWSLNTSTGLGGMRDAWKAVANNADPNNPVVIAVIDGSFYTAHEDFKEGTFVYPYNVTNGTTSIGPSSYNPNDPNSLADASHGTHVAGIIAANTNNSKGVAGVAYNQCKIMPIKVEDDAGRIIDRYLIDAFAYVDKMRKEGVNVRVVNISVGHGAESVTETDAMTYEAIERIYKEDGGHSGIVTVAASGNGEAETAVPFVEYPGDFDNVVSVINTDKNGDRRSSSNYNTSGQLMKGISAPGTDIKGIVARQGTYASMGGTSMAAPAVAGVMGLMFSVDPELTPNEAVSKLYSTALPANSSFTAEKGFGRIYAKNAVERESSIHRHYLTGNPSMYVGETQTTQVRFQTKTSHSAILNTVEWSSSNANVVSVTSENMSTGKLTAKSAGEAIIEARLYGTVVARQTVKVHGDWQGAHIVGDDVVPAGRTVQYAAYSYPSSEWTYSNSRNQAGSIDSSTGEFTSANNLSLNASYQTVIKATSKSKPSYTAPQKQVTVISNSLASPNYEVKLSATSFTYTGKAITPQVEVIMGKKFSQEEGYKLVEGTDYTVEWHNNVDAGTAYCYVNGKGDFTGCKEESFQINKAPIGSARIVLSATSFAYDGKAKAPSVTVYDIGGRASSRLSASADYTVSTRAVVTGTGSVTVSARPGSRNFQGSALRTFSVARPPSAPAPGSSSASRPTSMHRLYNPYSGEHFYTGDTAERNGLVKLGWRYEGVGWAAPAAGANVYRLYNRFSGDHHFTTSAPEKDACVKAGWTYEGVGWKSGGSRKVYREYNPYAKAFYHNYTASANEHSSLCRIGWKDEGVGWYGV